MKSTHTKFNVHGQRKKCAFGTQRNLYSTDSRSGFALGDEKNLRQLTQKIPTRYQRYQHAKIPTKVRSVFVVRFMEFHEKTRIALYESKHLLVVNTS